MEELKTHRLMLLLKVRVRVIFFLLFSISPSMVRRRVGRRICRVPFPGEVLREEKGQRAKRTSYEDKERTVVEAGVKGSCRRMACNEQWSVRFPPHLPRTQI